MPAHKTTDPQHDLCEKFVQLYGTEPQLVRAPGRVNLIGEHTDYNDGFVLPAAIQLQTMVGVAPRPDRLLLVFSKNYNEQLDFDLQQLPSAPRRHWSDYVVGVVRKLSERGVRLPGASLVLSGNIPKGLA